MADINPNWYFGTCGEGCKYCRATVEANAPVLDAFEKALGDGWLVTMAQTGGHCMCIRLSHDGAPGDRPESVYVLVTMSDGDHFSPEAAPVDGPFYVGAYNDGIECDEGNILSRSADLLTAVALTKAAL